MKYQFMIFSVLLMLVSGCNKKHTEDFYVFKSTLNNSIDFFVDEKEIGQIPYIDTTQSTNFTSRAKLISLDNGKHEITAKDRNGNYLSSVVIEITGEELNIGTLNTSNYKTSVNVVNVNNPKYKFKNRSANGVQVFSFE